MSDNMTKYSSCGQSHQSYDICYKCGLNALRGVALLEERVLYYRNELEKACDREAYWYEKCRDSNKVKISP